MTSVISKICFRYSLQPLHSCLLLPWSSSWFGALLSKPRHPSFVCLICGPGGNIGDAAKHSQQMKSCCHRATLQWQSWAIFPKGIIALTLNRLVVASVLLVLKIASEACQIPGRRVKEENSSCPGLVCICVTHDSTRHSCTRF